MATKAVKMVIGHLTCPVCCEMFKNPKYLPCYHSFCEDCLKKLVETMGGSEITCPQCRKTSLVPAGGPKDLPSNFFMNNIAGEIILKQKIIDLQGQQEVKCDVCIRNNTGAVLCVDCTEFLCGSCYEHHKHSKDCQSHHTMQLKEISTLIKKNVIVKPLKSKSLLCQEHEMELNFYCEKCEQLMCQYCAIRDHLEGGHDHNTVEMMAIKHKKELDKIMILVEEMMDRLVEAHKTVSSARDEIRSQTNDIDQQIDAYYDQLMQRLQQQREDLKNESHEISSQKMEMISQQLGKMESAQGQLEHVKDLNKAVKNGSGHEVLFIKKQVSEVVKQLTDDFSALTLEPVASTCMEFGPVKNYENSLPKFGVLVSNKLEVSGIPKWVIKGTEIQLTMTKRLCSSNSDQIMLEVWQRKGGIHAVPIEDNRDGSYTASFVANQTGMVKLLVSINGQHVKGSPYSVQVRKHRALDQPSKIINDGGKLGKPWGIAFGQDGMWAVTDESNHCVCIFDSQGQLVRKFGSKGNEKGLFNNPKGLAFDCSNYLYVVDHFNNRVQKFDITGHYLLQFGGYYGFYYGQLKHPVGITVYNKKVFIVDMKNHRISVFQCDGQFSHVIESDKLNHPYDVAVSKDNQILVANWYHHCISIFSMDGDYLGEIGGTNGRHKGQLAKPCGVTIDLYGFVIINEWHNNRASIFNKDGIFVHCFGSFGSDNGRFIFPYGIAVSPDGSIYVTDHNNQRIQIFSDY